MPNPLDDLIEERLRIGVVPGPLPEYTPPRKKVVTVVNTQTPKPPQKITNVPTSPVNTGKLLTTPSNPGQLINELGEGKPAFHCTGPVIVLVRFPIMRAVAGGQNHPTTAGKAYYLGTCEQFPVQEEEVINLPVYDDLSMAASPRDREYAGSNETIILPLNRFNYKVLNNVIAAPRHGRKDGTGEVYEAGRNGHMDRGSLIIGQGNFFELWLLNTYFGTRNWLAYHDMPAGTYYPFCSLAANNTPKQGSGRTQIRMLAVEANWNYHEPTGKWFMKTSDMAYLRPNV